MREEQEDRIVEQEVEQEEKVVFGEELKDPELAEPDKPRYDVKDMASIMVRALEIPGEIKAYEDKLIDHHSKDDFINKRTQEIKDRIYINVTNEKTTGAYKYIDQASVDKEVTKRLQNSKMWDSVSARIYSEVSKEIDNEGKPVYTNDKSRQAETTKRIYEDAEIKAHNFYLIKAVKEEREEGKLIYTNEKTREIEVQNRLNNHIEYQVLIEEQKKNFNETLRTKNILGRLRGEFKSIELIIDLLKIRYKMN